MHPRVFVISQVHPEVKKPLRNTALAPNSELIFLLGWSKILVPFIGCQMHVTLAMKITMSLHGLMHFYSCEVVPLHCLGKFEW